MDTFFATNKSGKSSQGHTCCQLFVTDKSFVYVVHMKSKGGVIQAIKKLLKILVHPRKSFVMRRLVKHLTIYTNSSYILVQT